MLIFRDATSGRAVRVNAKNEDVIGRLEKMGWARQPDVPADVTIGTVDTVEQLDSYDTPAPKPAAKTTDTAAKTTKAAAKK